MTLSLSFCQTLFVFLSFCLSSSLSLFCLSVSVSVRLRLSLFRRSLSVPVYVFVSLLHLSLTLCCSTVVTSHFTLGPAPLSCNLDNDFQSRSDKCKPRPPALVQDSASLSKSEAGNVHTRAT